MSVVLTTTNDCPETVCDAEPEINGLPTHEEEEAEEGVREAELVVFDGTTQGLGLKICGGCSADGREVHGIFIRRVLPGGLAEHQGGLEDGDLILEVNGEQMEGVTYDRALAILRQASASDHVEMVIARDQEARESFLEVMARYSRDIQKTEYFPAKIVNGEVAYPADTIREFHSKMAKSTEKTYSDSTDQMYDAKSDYDDELPNKANDLSFEDGSCSSYHSPVSSCNSELARHIPPTSPVQFDARQAGSTCQPAFSLRSLQTVLSRSFPTTAVDEVSPACRFPVAKLEKTLQTLGFVISAQKHIELLKHIPVDDQGLASFADFVRAVQTVFSGELQTRSSNSQSSTPLPESLSPASQSPRLCINNDLEEENPMMEENNMLRKQIEALKEEVKEQKHLCQKAEEQVLSLRKESQGAMEESRSLRSKLRLAEQSQEAARKMEQDYEQVVAMLESEISHLRLQISKSDAVSEHRRLAVAACQLKKSESSKKTFEVATSKLIAHVQHVQDILSTEVSLSSRPGEADKGDRQKKKRHKALQTLTSEGQDVITTVQTLLEQVPLPFGWEENYTADGVRYYINHLNQTTSWTHPSSNVEHQSITMAAHRNAAKPPAAVQSGKTADRAANLV